MNRYVADYETTTKESDCRVWGWGIYSITADKTKIGTNLKSFFDQLQRLKSGSVVYFHNLKFDGEFMLYHLLENGFKHTKEYKLEPYQFNTLIDGMGNWYSMKIKFKYSQIVIYDSLKIIPLKVSQIPKAFGLDQLKGDIDYHKERPVGYLPTKKEIKYIKHDVEIVGKALVYFFKQKLDKMTQAGNAFHDFKTIIGKEKFKKLYPVLDNQLDHQLRKSYKGGFTYVNPKFQGKDIGKGRVYDVNSLYPYVMKSRDLPYGEPQRFEGEYVQDDHYNLYIIHFRCQFELKKDYLPTMQIKNNMFFNARKYLESSDGAVVELTLTNIDFKLFKKHYNIFNLEYHYGWKFKSTNTLFNDYVEKWAKIKKECSINGNSGLRSISKLMLNSLYGKFGLNPVIESKIPYLNEDGLVKYKRVQDDDRDSVYIAVASFVTSYAREITLSAAQENFDRFIYADTDSIHIIGDEDAKGIKIDSVELGAWDFESSFTKARFLRAKCYLEKINDKNSVTVAGLPSNSHNKVTFDNFYPGLKIEGKLMTKRVRGGIVLTETTYEIKI